MRRGQWRPWSRRAVGFFQTLALLMPWGGRVAAEEGAPILYVALGDSTGVGVGAAHGGGYPARLAQRAGSGVRLVNACVSGARVHDVWQVQLGPALAARPEVVTLGIGINDVTRATDPKAFARDYDRLTSALARSGARVVVVNVLDLSLSPLAQGASAQRSLRARVKAINAVIAAAARRRRLALVDLFAISQANLHTHPEFLSGDRFHPSDLGYERWADAMAPAFERALSEVRLERRGVRPASASELR